MTDPYNPFDPDQVDHDRDVLTQLRREAPVVELMPGFFYVTRYDDIVEISRDAKRFPQAPFSPLADDPRTPDELQLGESNPPGHTKIRKILASVLTSDPWSDRDLTLPDVNTLTRNAARETWERAGVGPDDLDLVELHDCFATAELRLPIAFFLLLLVLLVKPHGLFGRRQVRRV